MRKNKGYQKAKNGRDSYASGNNISLEQYLEEIDGNFNKRIEEAKKSYAYIARKTTLTGNELREYCCNLLLCEIKFDDSGELIPLEEVINYLEEARERYKQKMSYHYVKRTVNKDNQKFVYNSGGGGYFSTRVPSMKRSNATWKKFYELFPYYKEHYNELNNKNGLKLKKVW